MGVLTREEGEEQGPGEQSHSGNSVQFRHGAATQPTGQMRPQSPWSGTCRERPPAHAHQEHLTLSIWSWGSLRECLFPLSFLHPTTWVRPLLQPPVLSTASPRKPPPSKDSPPTQPLGILAQRQSHDSAQLCLVCSVEFSSHPHRNFHRKTPHPVQRVRPRKACWIFSIKVKDKVGTTSFTAELGVTCLTKQQISSFS